MWLLSAHGVFFLLGINRSNIRNIYSFIIHFQTGLGFVRDPTFEAVISPASLTCLKINHAAYLKFSVDVRNKGTDRLARLYACRNTSLLLVSALTRMSHFGSKGSAIHKLCLYFFCADRNHLSSCFGAIYLIDIVSVFSALPFAISSACFFSISCFFAYTQSVKTWLNL